MFEREWPMSIIGKYRLYRSPERTWVIADDSGWYDGEYATQEDAIIGAKAQS